MSSAARHPAKSRITVLLPAPEGPGAEATYDPPSHAAGRSVHNNATTSRDRHPSKVSPR